MCDVNRVQGVTSSQGRLLTSVPMSALRGRKEFMRTEGWEERREES